jgi:cellulose synthase/poly-beta-1,6-N-acetylglucosamine synthase-like glycosyltransferase
MEFGPFAVLFWLSFVAVAYAYFVYPVLIWLFAALFARHATAAPLSEDECPRVSVLIAAYNEEAEIEGQVERLLALDYPQDRLEIVIASDGSSDATAAIVERYADRGVRLLDYKVRRGKATVLNSSFSALSGDIVVLSDANTSIAPDAVRMLVRWFRDPKVGVVCGRLDLIDPVTGHNVDGLYWKYETFLKKCEGKLGGLLGANGGIYALRRKVHVPIPNNTIIDDFVMPLLVKLRHGCSIVYDPEAVATEETPAHIGSEFKRRARIGAGGFQSIPVLWRLLSPRQGWTAFTFFSHKVMRWLCPFFLLSMVAACAVLAWGSPFYLGLLFAQVGLFVVSVLAGLMPPRLKVLKPLRLTTMFTSMNLALLVGFWRWISGRQQAAWVRTARLAEAARVPETEGAVG